MHNSCIEIESNMHNCAYATSLLTNYHHPKCLEHDIITNVPRLEIVELGFNRSFDDMTIIEVIDFLIFGSYLHWQYGYVRCLQ
jgi:hypothetical protein